MIRIPIILLCCGFVSPAYSLVFLSDIATPSFLIDVQALQKTCKDSPIPPILLPASGQQLVTTRSTEMYGACPHTFDATLDPINILDVSGTDASSSASGDVCYGYIHCRVTRPRQSQEDSTMMVLAELDIPVNTPAAHLVLGLNNHHVVSYYWARSAGAGAAMEAPGIVLHNNTLQWESKAGFTDCNSNDGKRSEWVNFLRTGDQVQLRPASTEDTVLQPCFSNKIYGISAAGRPLGSEPVVVCEWMVEKPR